MSSSLLERKFSILVPGAGLALALALGACSSSDRTHSEDALQESGLGLGLPLTASASSVQNVSLGAANAVDGITGTRWSSASSDPQWLRVDLGSKQAVARVVLRWEAAYAKSYQIQASDDGTTWLSVYSTTQGKGGVEDIALSANARYLRLYSTQRATTYGISLWEFEAYGATGAPVAVPLPARIEAEKYVSFSDTTPTNLGTASCSSTAVDAQTTTDPNGGVCNIAYTDPGEWLEYDVSVASAGKFDLTVRLAAGSTGKSVHLEVDGVNVSGALVAPSAGWQSFADVTAPGVSIAAGAHRLRLVMDTGLSNVNYLEVKAATTTPPASTACKRGVAYGSNSVPDLQALSRGVSWWYNWATTPDSAVRSDYARLGVEYVPMLWDERYDVNASIANIPQGARTLLTFNEPNFFSQANLSPEQAAAEWPRVQQIAAARGLKIASPALNYCGGGCFETDPFKYFDKFFAACPNCQVDYLAVHWYACTLPALQNYINGMKKYGKPIWLTEFACGDGDTALANQKAYMQAAVPYLESEPAVVRYAWFSGRTGAIPNVDLLGASGALTELGQIYVNLPQSASCQR